jgi:hypothetical protein
LQALEKKALSRGIIRKPACILSEITIRKSQLLSYRKVRMRHTKSPGTYFAKAI